MTAVRYFGRDGGDLCRDAAVSGRPPADIAEELFRCGWRIVTLLRDHHRVVGWVRHDPGGSRAHPWYGEPS